MSESEGASEEVTCGVMKGGVAVGSEVVDAAVVGVVGADVAGSDDGKDDSVGAWVGNVVAPIRREVF